MKTDWEISTENSKQSTTIPDKELLMCHSPEDAASMIEEIIQTDFEQRAWACFDSEDILEKCRKLFSDNAKKGK
jgi:hypothetical protein